jgi:hypothetical protein
MIAEKRDACPQPERFKGAWRKGSIRFGQTVVDQVVLRSPFIQQVVVGEASPKLAGPRHE